MIVGDRGLYQVSLVTPSLTLLFRLSTSIKYWLKLRERLSLQFSGAIRKNLSSPVTNKSVLNKWGDYNRQCIYKGPQRNPATLWCDMPNRHATLLQNSFQPIEYYFEEGVDLEQSYFFNYIQWSPKIRIRWLFQKSRY